MNITIESSRVQANKRRRLMGGIDAAILLLMSGMTPTAVADVLHSDYDMPYPKATRLTHVLQRVIDD